MKDKWGTENEVDGMMLLVAVILVLIAAFIIGKTFK